MKINIVVLVVVGILAYWQHTKPNDNEPLFRSEEYKLNKECGERHTGFTLDTYTDDYVYCIMGEEVWMFNRGKYAQVD